MQSLHGLSLEQTEYLVRDRLSWMRFCRLGPEDAVPDAKRSGLPRGADRGRSSGGAVQSSRPGDQYGGVSAAWRSDRRCDACGGATQAQHGWREGADQGGQVGGRDLARQARQGASEGRGRPLDDQAVEDETRADGAAQVDIAIPVYGYKSHLSNDRAHGLIRRQLTTDSAQHDGARLREGLIDRTNTARDVWADSAYRAAENEELSAAPACLTRTRFGC